MVFMRPGIGSSIWSGSIHHECVHSDGYLSSLTNQDMWCSRCMYHFVPQLQCSHCPRPRTSHGLVSSLMEYLVSWTSRCLDTRHLYEMTRSRDPRDLVIQCVQLLTTSMGFRYGMVSGCCASRMRDHYRIPRMRVWRTPLTHTQLRVAVCS